MSGLPENIEELLTELVEKSRHEMNIVLALADAIRRTDDQLLREVRSVSLHHELRREAIKNELQELSSRLCAFPNRPHNNGASNTLNRPAPAIENGNAHDPRPRTDWHKAVEDIDAGLEDALGAELPRH